MKVSPGCISAMNTSALADAPECGCTLANEQPNSFLTRSIAICSDHVDKFAAAVIALTRQALGVFVGQHRALRFKDGAADDVLRRDQLDLVALAAEFAGNGGRDVRIALAERGGEERLGRKCRIVRD